MSNKDEENKKRAEKHVKSIPNYISAAFNASMSNNLRKEEEDINLVSHRIIFPYLCLSLNHIS